MSKLLKLKEWLTVKEAAKRLSINAGEEVTEADVLRLALDGHLTLSVYFVNHAKGRPFKIEPFDKEAHILEATRDFVKDHPSIPEQLTALNEFVLNCRGEILPGGNEIMILGGDDKSYTQLEGVWDLLMLGAERLDVEHLYQSITGGPEISLVCLGGPMIASLDRSQHFQILDSFNIDTHATKPKPPSNKLKISKALRESLDYLNESLPSAKPKISKEARESLDYLNEIFGPITAPQKMEEDPPRWDYETIYYPAAGLPEDSVFVVRTSALRELEEKLLADEKPQDNPLHSSERKSTEQIIAALAAMAGLNLSVPYKADETLRTVAANHGLELPSSPETIVKFLKAAAARAGSN